ncbi:DUF4912 domain-containing protein [Leptodesmis sp.]|uniref:DUF4912 domain-containing protein n=1 Tax=Leptodesmis sp. TaxID=3100501 RepID=UPI00405348E4
MTTRSKNYVPLLPLAVLLAFATAPKPQIAGLTLQPAAAQSTPSAAFPLPTSVPQGTKVVVDSSSTMQKISEALKQSFEEQYPGTSVTVTPASSDEAVAAVAAGKADLAAIGRPLTEAEKAQGLVAVPVSRNKIAMIVGPESPFKGSLTVDQFAQIFRGEVTNWSQVGGPSAPVRLVDRPATSDTQQAFQNYPVFQKAPFKTGSTAVQVEDSTEAVIAKLGQDGLGYAIAEQVVEQPDVRIVPMYNTPPTDPKYPFSQSLYYIYKGPTPSTGAKAFLGLAVTPANQRIIEAARTATSPAATSPTAEATASPQAPATTPEKMAPNPWWWLLVPIIGIPLAAWLFRRNQAALVATPVSDRNRIILTPRNCRDAYAYWELPDAKTVEARNLALRLYDVTGIDLDRQQPHSMKQFDCPPGEQDMHLPIALDDRDYLVEIGYPTEDGGWTKLARSTHVRVPKCSPIETVAAAGNTGMGAASIGTAAAAAAATLAGAGVVDKTMPANPPATPVSADAVGKTVTSGDRTPGIPTTPITSTPVVQPIGEEQETSRIILVPRDAAHGYAYWEVPEAAKAAARQQGGEQLKLRIYDVTDMHPGTQEPHSMAEFDCLESDCDRHVFMGDPTASNSTGRDYVAELGYSTPEGNWLRLARSDSAHFSTSQDESILPG